MSGESPNARDTTYGPLEFLVIGHITRDLTQGGGWRIGGAALYAARTALLRGLRVGVVTSAPEDVAVAARNALPAVAFQNIPARDATTFENIYTPGGRIQYVRAVASMLTADAIPGAWRSARVAMLSPVAQEVDPTLARVLSCKVLGATPQGWLRHWDERGRVRPAALDRAAQELLPALTALVVSREDVVGVDVGADARNDPSALFAEWSRVVPYIAVTSGASGAELWRDGRATLLPGYPANEIDPTGAGDVFAATFFCALNATGSAELAMDEANRVAALSVEGIGISAIPTPQAADARFAAQGG